MRFYVGMHHPHNAYRVPRAFISINAIAKRKSTFRVNEWILDSGGFTEIEKHGLYRMSPGDYAGEICRWSTNGSLVAAVAQDFMCESQILSRTGLTVADHQQMTIDRFDAIAAHNLGGVYLMPCLQGRTPEDYQRHVYAYGDRLSVGAYVGVGSVCRRNGSPVVVAEILRAIKAARPDLKLHGFGLKISSLREGAVRDRLFSADSMAWSFAARMQGRNGNDPAEAVAFLRVIEGMPVQSHLQFE